MKLKFTLFYSLLFFGYQSESKSKYWYINKLSKTSNETGIKIDVYVLDSGIDILHNEFQGINIKIANFVEHNNVGNVIGSVSGSVSKEEDCNGHGTSVASIIAGKNVGISKNVNLISVKVLNCGGMGQYQTIISGIKWVSQHARKSKNKSIVNISINGKNSELLLKEMSKNKGLYFIVAAGNDGKDVCKNKSKINNVIMVGSTNKNGEISDFSNYGKCIDTYTYGENILTAEVGKFYKYKSGTSMATALISGVLANYLSRDPDSGFSQFKHAFQIN